MDPITIGITAGSALLGGISSLFAADSQAELEERKKKRTQEILGRSIIDTGELDTLLALSNRRFNSQLQRVLNTSALRSRGLENSNVVGAAAAGEIAGQAAQSESSIRTGVMMHNESVFQQLAAVEAATPTPSNPFEEFVTGGISGAMAGMEISKSIGNMDKMAGIGMDSWSRDQQPGTNPNPMLSTEVGQMYVPPKFNAADWGTPDDDQWWRKGKF